MTNEPNKHTETEDLIIGHFDGTLNEAQESELATALSASSEAKRSFLSYMRMEGRLHSLGRDGFLRDPCSQKGNHETIPSMQTNELAATARSGRRFAASLAIVAALMIVFLSGLPWLSSVNASSVVRRAKAAAAELVDRTYSVEVSAAEEHSSESQLTINVRGGGRFLVRPVDEAFIFGCDGTEYWLTQQGGPVWVTSDARSLAPKVRRVIPNMRLFGIAASPNEPLLLDMNGVLSLIERRHNVELITSADPAEHHVRATLKSTRQRSQSNAPNWIDVWADAESGVGLRAELKWADGRSLRFEIKESMQLSDNWYHYSEHTSKQDVRRLHSKDLP